MPLSRPSPHATTDQVVTTSTLAEHSRETRPEEAELNAKGAEENRPTPRTLQVGLAPRGSRGRLRARPERARRRPARGPTCSRASGRNLHEQNGGAGSMNSDQIE